MINYLVFGISISFISWLVGIILNGILSKTTYFEKLSYLNFIPSKTINKRIGIPYFKWVVKNTFFKFFNQKIRVENRKTNLTEIRKEMTLAETSHLIAFAFVMVFAVHYSVKVNLVFGLVITAVNILMNLYPSLLQQENKRRIDLLIEQKSKSYP